MSTVQFVEPMLAEWNRESQNWPASRFVCMPQVLMIRSCSFAFTFVSNTPDSKTWMLTLIPAWASID